MQFRFLRRFISDLCKNKTKNYEWDSMVQKKRRMEVEENCMISISVSRIDKSEVIPNWERTEEAMAENALWYWYNIDLLYLRWRSGMRVMQASNLILWWGQMQQVTSLKNAATHFLIERFLERRGLDDLRMAEKLLQLMWLLDKTSGEGKTIDRRVIYCLWKTSEHSVGEMFECMAM